MIGKCEIKSRFADTDGGSSIKLSTLRVNGFKEVDLLCKCTERTTDTKTLGHTGEKILNECYIDLTLDKLRELDDDRYAQDRYIMQRSRFLDRGMVYALVIKLRMPYGSEMEKADYDYLCSLLTWSRNDIFIMPILEFEGTADRKIMPSRYNSFTEKMLELKDSWTANADAAMGVPHYYSRRRIDDLFGIYERKGEDPRFVAVDYNNGRMDKPGATAGTIIKHFKEGGIDDTFLYAVHVRPYRKAARTAEDIAGISDAWDMYMVNYMFNAVGPTHSRPHSVRVELGWSNMGRLFDESRIKYLRLNRKDDRAPFCEWIEDRYGIVLDDDPMKNPSVYQYLRRYNFEKTNAALAETSEAIRKNDTDEIREFIAKSMPDEVKEPRLGC